MTDNTNGEHEGVMLRHPRGTWWVNMHAFRRMGLGITDYKTREKLQKMTDKEFVEYFGGVCMCMRDDPA